MSTATSRLLGSFLAVLLVTGCGGLLPKTSNVTKSPWASYRDMQLTFDKIVPGKTNMAELKELGSDFPYAEFCDPTPEPS